MRIEKEFEGEDEVPRIWVIDTDKKFIGYKGQAKDFKNIDFKNAQDFIDEVILDNIKEDW